MSVSQKCQYALRAMFELAKRDGRWPTTISQIAEAQAIPPKFLELILGELRQGGFVRSRRGRTGGYLMVGRPANVAVGKVMRFVDGPVAPVKCVASEHEVDCPLHENCAFVGMWSEARDAVAGVYDGTTFQDLADAEVAARKQYIPSYCI